MAEKEDSKSLIPTDLIEEYAEIGADKLVEEAKPYLSILDPLGSEIPYVKTLVAAVKLPKTISDFILGKKVYAFLYSASIDDAKLKKSKRSSRKLSKSDFGSKLYFR